MSKLRRLLAMSVAGGVAAMLVVWGGKALSAQDKYSVQIPDGIAFSDFRGYEGWQVVSVSQTEDALKVILANPVMIEAYLAGIPGNGAHFPDGSKIAKIIWSPKKSAESPFPVRVPDSQKAAEFIEKDSKRFAESGGWGYAPFDYDAASGSFTPRGSGAACGTACHAIVAAKDSIFTAYGTR